MKKQAYKLEEDQSNINKKESAFRERSHHSDNERLRDLFTDRNDENDDKESQERAENDAEYAMLLRQLWSKYKSQKHQAHNLENQPHGVVKLYKDKIIKKRTPNNWGPTAFKKKRSPNANDNPNLNDYAVEAGEMKQRLDDDNIGTNYNSPEEDESDIREEYAIAFQPLDDEPIHDLSNDGRYTYDVVAKRFPISKRSSGPFLTTNNYQKKRFAEEENNHKFSRRFRSSAGTDPKIIKDLSEIFGDSNDNIIKSPVKRSSSNDENSHDIKPPQLAFNHNNTHEHNSSSVREDDSHEHHGHNIHHPGMSQEVEHIHPTNTDKPIIIKKKSIDWSDYFGIDRRKKKSFLNNLGEDRLRKQYFDTFNREVFYPSNSFSKHTKVKRNFVETKPREETEIQMESARAMALQNTDRDLNKNTDSKLDDIDKKLKNMESMIVDEALHYSNVGDELDSKEEQEVKEKLLSRLAAAYSLEKMRKAMKEFQQSLRMQKIQGKFSPTPEVSDEGKSKRIAVKKEKAELSDNDIPTQIKTKEDKQIEDFEGEQGAGHYLDGRTEEQYSEGYMGGSGRHRIPVSSMGKLQYNYWLLKEMRSSMAH